MIKISQALNIAFHSMLILRSLSKDKECSVAFMAEKIGVSNNHLAKVMQRLSKAKLVASRRGPTGGYFIKKPASRISLLSIYEAIEGTFSMQKCLLEKPLCDGSNCILGDILGPVREKIYKYLKTTHLDRF